MVGTRIAAICRLVGVMSLVDPLATQSHSPFVEQLSIQEGLQGETTVDSFEVARVGAKKSAILQVSTEKRRYVAVFDDLEGKSHPGLVATHLRHGSLWMVPTRPTFGDLDGDGRPEVLFRYSTALADRVVITAMVIQRRKDKCRVLAHPRLIARSRPHLQRGDSFLAEGKFVSVTARKEKIRLQGVYGGGDFRLIDRRKGAGSCLLGMMLIRAPGPKRRYRVAMHVFRLGESGFTPEPTWNQGVAMTSHIPVPLRDFDANPLIELGWRRNRRRR